MTSARDVDERSDIFSLGALLYRLTAGQTAYKGSSIVSILASMATEGLVPVRTLTPDAPEAFAAVIERCLSQDKAMRYPTVAHLAHALVPYATRRGRVIIEQILATLNVTFPDDGLGDTMVRAVVAPVPTPRNLPSGMPPAPVSGPPALGPAMQTGPHFTVSAPASTPPLFERARQTAGRSAIPQAATIGIMLAVLAIIAAVVIWRALRPPRSATDDEPQQSASTTTGALPPVVATTTATSPFVPPDPPPTAAGVDPSAPRPKSTPTPLARPRPQAHPSATHAPTSGGAPNPADVPGGRH
jgi:serine/threonine-protein kinase